MAATILEEVGLEVAVVQVELLQAEEGGVVSVLVEVELERLLDAVALERGVPFEAGADLGDDRGAVLEAGWEVGVVGIAAGADDRNSSAVFQDRFSLPTKQIDPSRQVSGPKVIDLFLS